MRFTNIAMCITLSIRPALAIVGGNDVKEPISYMASIVESGWFGDKAICGGVLIGKESVLTAASCVDAMQTTGIRVKYGGLDRSQLAVTQVVQRIYQHELYNKETLDYDIAVLGLKNPISPMQSYATPSSSSNLNGTKARVMGWGKTSSAGEEPLKLQEAEMTFVNNSNCKEKRKDVTHSQRCIESASASVCNGDAGGPVFSSDGNLVGTISFEGTGCPADSTILPNIFTDYFALRDWIESKVV
jgi:secreted trypsin-like serine protease